MANMHLVTGYAGQAHVTAADQASLYAALFGTDSFVLSRGNKLAASIVTNNNIQIADGDILFQGRHIRLEEGSTVNLTIENGAQGYYRNDLIVARYTKNPDSGVEEVNLVVIKGTAVESDPYDPEYTEGDIITNHDVQADMPLYRVPLNGLNVQPLVSLFSVMGTVHEAADSAQKTANSAADTADSALAEAESRIPAVSGATEGHIPVFDDEGNLASSGVAMSGFHRAKFSLSGTTLTITTVS